MILCRYFVRELLLNLLGITAALVSILMMNEFMFMLPKISSGQLTLLVGLEIMLLQLPEFITFLLPLGLYLSIFLVIGRWCAENEMVVCYACGISRTKFYSYITTIAVIFAIIIGSLSFALVPLAHALRINVQRRAVATLSISKVLPRRFQPIDSNGGVVYAGHRSDEDIINDVFVARPIIKPGQVSSWEVIAASSAEQKTGPGGLPFIWFKSGSRTVVNPGQMNLERTDFKTYGLALVAPDVPISRRIDLLSTGNLLHIIHQSTSAMAEWQWRWAMPLSVIIMSLLAIPIAQVKPRQGKFGRFLPAILIYIAYANLLFATRSLISSGKLSPLLGMWCVHLLFAILALFLIGRNLQWWQFRSRPKLRGD